LDSLAQAFNQSWFWKYFFSHLGWVDWVLAAFFLVGIILGLKNGLSQEMPKVAETFITLCFTMEFYPFCSQWVAERTPFPEAYIQPGTFALLGLLTWFIVHLSFKSMGKWVRLQIAAPFEAVFGALVGGVRFFIFFGLISYLLTLFPLDWLQRSYKVQSWSGQMLIQVPTQIHGWVRNLVVRQFKP